ncbi:hypothetical protein DSO10_04615 [Listeria monocytogenes]|uniref:hypothetical protein n=1 Tax=Listeria monocytogenes TaxID=1639 RepID=UPI000F1B4E27|nr:hypothetical protein [Listeria monocytogenes]MCN73784.1 hypothetical protein [Listeria monocytogenes]TYU88943.1 hypothetical protein FZX01_05380 [Listeria monocytogenes]
MNNKLKNVWNRQHEAAHKYRDTETFELKEGFHYGKIKKICKEEGVNIDDFLEYARQRVTKED